VLLALGRMLMLAGCAAPPSSTSAPADLNRALEDYHAGRYAAALEEAAAVQNGTAGVRSREAAYVGGLAAYRLGDLLEARDRLNVATASASPTTAGKARAVLGLVYLELDQPREAATHLAAAARSLQDDEARRAARHAAEAYERAGDELAADEWTRVAEGRGRMPTAGLPGSGGVFTLQAGAYRQRPRAEQAALEAAELAETHGLLPVRSRWADSTPGPRPSAPGRGSVGSSTSSPPCPRGDRDDMLLYTYYSRI
jgi:tetratricopeptide (TPR) repeat protein